MKDGSSLSFIAGMVLVAVLAAAFIGFIFYIAAISTNPDPHVKFDDAYYGGRSPAGIMPSGGVGIRIGDSSMGISLEDGSIGIMP